MQALGVRYLLFPGLFGALLLYLAAMATDALVRAVWLHAARLACINADSPLQKRRFVFELADIAAALPGGKRAAAVAA